MSESDRDKHAGRRRHVPRYVVGSVNLTEFFVTLATSGTFIVTLGLANLAPVIPLVSAGSSALRSPVTWSKSYQTAC